MASRAQTKPWTWGNRVVGYDPQRRRVWIAGQRVHHGVTGLVVAGAGLAGLAARRLSPSGGVLGTVLGTALIAHDWHDRSAWFTRGSQD